MDRSTCPSRAAEKFVIGGQEVVAGSSLSGGHVECVKVSNIPLLEFTCTLFNVGVLRNVQNGRSEEGHHIGTPYGIRIVQNLCQQVITTDEFLFPALSRIKNVNDRFSLQMHAYLLLVIPKAVQATGIEK